MMAPINWAIQNRTNRIGLMIPRSTRAKLTFGLNNPPVTRKKSQLVITINKIYHNKTRNTTHAATRRLSPIQVEMNMICSIGEGFTPLIAAAIAVAWMPPSPIKRKKVVPTNSKAAA